MYSRISGHSFKLNHVYMESRSTVCGPLESIGPLGQFFDFSFPDYYANQSSFEKAECHMLEKALNICLEKKNIRLEDIDIVLGSDLLNQNTSVHYMARHIPLPFIGIYSACSGICSTLSVLALLIEGKMINRGLTLISSHNLTAERQYRYPIEYGVQRRITSTFTSTGAIAVLLSDKKSPIKIEGITLGRVVDYKQKDPNDMGRAMAPAAYDTLIQHFHDFKRTSEDYDLIVTGDLSTYGSSILKLMFKKSDINLENYNDCGTMLYNNNQDVDQGGSGCACSALVTIGYLCTLLETKKIKKVLLVATGALLSPVMSAQKETIPAIAHAVILEAIL